MHDTSPTPDNSGECVGLRITERAEPEAMRGGCYCGANLGVGTHGQDECRVGAAVTRRLCGGCLEPGCPNCWMTPRERMDADPIGPSC